MGLFKSIFSNSVKIQTSGPIIANHGGDVPLKSVPTAIQELVMLSLAESYKIGETKYPQYLRTQYGIGFPNELLGQMQAKGFIRPASATESLPHLKGAQLKEIASHFEIPVSGKKNELSSRIADAVSETELSPYVLERYWCRTELGDKIVAQNNYMGFYLEKHPYNLVELGVDVNEYAKLFSSQHNGTVRDVVWSELNRRSVEEYGKAMTSRRFRPYCEVLRTMALFLEEENRHTDALSMYMRYMHYRCNFEAAYGAIQNYSLLRKMDEAVDMLFINAEILPFIAEELTGMSIGCGFDSNQLQQFMRNALIQEKDTGIFSPDELTQFIMYGLNGNRQGQESVCRVAMKSAVKSIPKR